MAVVYSYAGTVVHKLSPHWPEVGEHLELTFCSVLELRDDLIAAQHDYYD